MSNVLLGIADNIKGNSGFQSIFHRLYQFWLIHDLKEDVSDIELRMTLVDELYRIDISDSEVKKVVQSAFVFAWIEEGESVAYAQADGYHNLAYVIGVSLLCYVKFYKITSLKKVVYRLFTRLWLMVGRDKFVRTEMRDTDMFSKIEMVRKELRNKLSHKADANNFSAQDDIYLTDFQLDVLDKLRNDSNKVIGISWPTSSGKNFAVKHYFIDRLIAEGNINICIIVPSKALISEQQTMLRKEFEAYGIQANIFTYGDIKHYKELQAVSGRNVFIFTQERLHYFFELIKKEPAIFESFKLDILVVDESYKISHGNRWVLLNYIVKTLLSQRRVGKLILLSPMVKQLKTFWKILWIWEEVIHEKYSEFSPVFQNKFYLEETPRIRTKHFNYLSPLTGEKRLAFVCEIGFTPSEAYKDKLTKYAVLFSNKQPLIVFRDGPADVQKQASDIASESPNNRLYAQYNAPLMDYIRQTIGDGYELVEPLRKGVAFHHGKVPISIRSKVEENFKKWHIRVLCATSTLSEGVNLPVKYLLIWDDIKGKSRLDFRNLCWRVGRYSSHLSWSLFFVNPRNYKELLDGYGESDVTDDTPLSPLAQILEEEAPSEQDVKNKKDKFIDYLTSSNHKEYSNNQEFEYLTGFLFDIFYSTPNEFDNFVKRNTTLWDEYVAKLREKLGIIKADLEAMGSRWIKEICRKNIFIDPRKQLDLYESVRSGRHPLVAFNLTPTSAWFANAFKEFNLNIARAFLRTERNGTTQEEFYPAQSYLLDWVTEKSIPAMRRHRQWNDFIKFTALFEILEQDIAFKYLNAMNVYVDVVNLCVSELEEFEELRESLEHPEEYYDKKFVSYVEYGACTPLVFFLLNKGIHRESALILKDIMRQNGVPLFWENDEIEAKILLKSKTIRARISNPILLEEFNKIRT